MTLDDELRDALRAEADQAQPSPDGWDRLQERVGSAKGRRTRVWLPVVGRRRRGPRGRRRLAARER